MKKLIVIFGVMGAISLTGAPTLLALWLWTIAIPFMQSLEGVAP